MTQIRLLDAGDEVVLSKVAPDVFDSPVDAELAAEFLRDARHHIAVALDVDTVVGFASAVHYLHPDKRPELFINEVGVASSHRRRGIARQLLAALLEHGLALGCREAWVLTERPNAPAIALYEGLEGKEARDETVLFSFGLDNSSTAP